MIKAPVKTAHSFRGFVIFSLGIFGGLLLSNLMVFRAPRAAVMAQGEAPDLAAMQADIARLKELVPSQSHTMTDVGYQFANLWFAGKQKNWPLAEFFLNETRSHIAWTVRIRPVRRNPDGSSVDLRPIFDAVNDGPLKQLRQSIQDGSDDAFASTYRQMMAACYGCHVASAKPYLRPVIPQAPPQSIIRYDPGAR